jgi:hypothetical protein
MTPTMRQRRTRAQLWHAGETPESIRAALDSLNVQAAEMAATEEGARRHSQKQKLLIEELAILEGRTFPNSTEFDHS